MSNITRRGAGLATLAAATLPGAAVAQTPGIRAVAAHGHSPGHACYHIADSAAQYMVLADVTHRPELFARRPDFQVMFDFDPAAAANRVRLLDRIAAERMQVGGYHFPFPAQGFFAREGQGFRYVPADWAAA